MRHRRAHRSRFTGLVFRGHGLDGSVGLDRVTDRGGEPDRRIVSHFFQETLLNTGVKKSQ